MSRAAHRWLSVFLAKEPGDAVWGGRFAYFADPEDNLWEVAWNPYVTFDARGALVLRS